jgi:dimethylhistidine N-methyltransferase
MRRVGDDGVSERARSGIAAGTLRDEVLRGLQSLPKSLPPKLLYDARGARLFERITTLDEYYLTRAEVETLTARAAEISELAGARCALIEYGAGSGTKARILLDAMDQPAAYVPIDVSADQLARQSREISARYPRLAVRSVCADYTDRFVLPPLPPHARRLAFFPGSTIGNLRPTEATVLLQRIRHTVGPTGALVLGVDCLKDAMTLEAAYNDRRGVTAAFNLNVLLRLNRELGADFDLAQFRHRAWFNAAAGRIEMHLESLTAQTVHVAEVPIGFSRGETIWTESSYKYNRPQLDSIAAAAGFSIDHVWTDRQHRFWVAFLTPAVTRPQLDPAHALPRSRAMRRLSG